MELFLNLCWLALLVPAWTLWRRNVAADRSARFSFFVLCTLGCAFVLLFPVISASDDLHAMGQAIEETDPGFRQDGHRAGSVHSIPHNSVPAVLTCAPATPVLAQVGTDFSSPKHSFTFFDRPVPSGRAPPSASAVSL
jgi:hypothetical protein